MELPPEHSRLFGYMDARGWNDASTQIIWSQNGITKRVSYKEGGARLVKKEKEEQRTNNTKVV